MIPVDDSSMNYLVGMLYTQCFQALYRRADEKYNGRFACAECGPAGELSEDPCHLPQLNIGLNIIVQNIQQIKALYERNGRASSATATRCCSSAAATNRPRWVYCEAAGQGDHRHPHTADEGSQRLQLYQLPADGPDLMTIDEVRKLDTHKAIPVYTRKILYWTKVQHQAPPKH